MPLSLQELKLAANLLRSAKILTENVRELFFGAREVDSSARLSEIVIRLENERELVERLVAKNTFS
jgi:hypothetical protein